MASDEDLLKDAKEAFKEAESTGAENRADALADLKFARLGGEEQWPSEIVKKRRQEARPVETINRMPAFIRQVVNDARQNKPSIKVHPVDSGADVATAKVLDGLIRNIQASSDADVAYDTATDFAVSAGYGFWRVGVEYTHDDSFDKEIRIDRIANPFAVYGDPRSTAADSSDWNVAFVVDTIGKEELVARWPEAEAVGWDAYQGLNPPWRPDGDDVTYAEWWKREEVDKTLVRLSNGEIVTDDALEQMADVVKALGLQVTGERKTKGWKVTQRIITGAQVLETNDWAGRWIPIVPVYGDEVNVEGKRYFRSLIRDAKGAQVMFNFMRSVAAETLADQPRAPFIGPEEAFQGVDARKWATANREKWAYLSYKGSVAPQRQPPPASALGAIQEALSAQDDMKSIMGLYDASLGQKSNETSGRAILARQREGDVSTFHFIDNVSRAIRHTGRILLDLIPKVYTGERIVRTLGEDGTPGSVQLGQAPPGQPAAPPPPDAGAASPAPGPQPAGASPTAAPAAGLPAGVERIYDLSAGKYDITVESGPSFTTRREEAAQQMMDLLQAFPAAAPMIGDLLAKNLDWPGADEIAERLKAMAGGGADPQALARLQQEHQQAQQENMRLQAENAQIKSDKTIEAGKLEVDRAKVGVEQYKAHTDRMTAVRDILAPPPMPGDAPQLQ